MVEVEDARPQTPFTGVKSGAEQLGELLPPPEPMQIQSQGPVPVTVFAVPVEQRFVDGAVDVATLFADPQTPVIGVCKTGAEH